MSFPFPIAGGFHYPAPIVIPNTGVKPGFYGSPSGIIGPDGRWYNATNSTTMVNVTTFGAKSDGQTDDTVAVQAAVDELADTGTILVFSGKTMISSLITVRGVVNMLGGGGGNALGGGQSRIMQTNNLQGHLRFTNINGGGIWIQNISFEYLTVATASVSSVIFIATGSIWIPKIQNCTFYNGGIGLDFISVSNFSVISCTFFTSGDSTHSGCIGIRIQNTLNSDSGDSGIIDCTFQQGLQYGVYHLNAGGIRFIGNKINGSGWGYYVALNAATSDFTLVGNSIENNTIGGFHFDPGLSLSSNVIIACNEMYLTPSAPSPLIEFVAGPGFKGVAINTNIFPYAFTIAALATIVMRNVSNYTVTGNTWFNTTGSNQVGLDLDSTCQSGYIHPIDTVFANMTVSIDDTQTNYYQSSSGTARNHLIPISTTTGVTNLKSLTASGVITMSSIYGATPGPSDRYVKVGTDNILASAATLADDPLVRQLMNRIQALEAQLTTMSARSGWFA